jgi:hypothetical protein
MNARDLTAKFTSYACFIASREWARENALLPALVSIAPDIAQERRMLRVPQARIVPLRGCELWTTTEALLNERGPLSSIWSRRILQRDHATPPDASFRQCLFSVLSEKPESKT